MRSFLTMLGIIIGIASIIAIVSTIKGTNEQIKQNLVGAGNNTIDIKLSEIMEAANENCKKTGYKIMLMEDAISEITGVAAPCNAFYPMYVGTNPERILGASILLYETYLEDLAVQIEDDLCIMPSSIHELIIAPLSLIDPGYILKTVREINEEIVGVQETLSDNIYFYRRNEHKLSLVTTRNLNNLTC